MRVFCLLFIKGKKKSEAQVLKFPAGEFVTLWAHPHTCTQYPYKIQLENAMQAMQPFYLYLVQYHKFRLKDYIKICLGLLKRITLVKMKNLKMMFLT